MRRRLFLEDRFCALAFWCSVFLRPSEHWLLVVRAAGGRQGPQGQVRRPSRLGTDGTLHPRAAATPFWGGEGRARRLRKAE